VWAGDGWSDLLNLYIEYLDSHWLKFANIPPNDERLKFTQTWLQNMVRWKNSDYNKTYSVNNLEEGWDIPDEAEDHMIEIMAESDREDIGQWMIDVHRNFNELDAIRLIKLREIYLQLTTPERVLWDLYFTKMMSLRQIGKKIDLPHMAVFTMIRDLKNKIRLWIGE